MIYHIITWVGNMTALKYYSQEQQSFLNLEKLVPQTEI